MDDDKEKRVYSKRIEIIIAIIGLIGVLGAALITSWDKFSGEKNTIPISTPTGSPAKDIPQEKKEAIIKQHTNGDQSPNLISNGNGNVTIKYEKGDSK